MNPTIRLSSKAVKPEFRVNGVLIPKATEALCRVQARADREVMLLEREIRRLLDRAPLRSTGRVRRVRRARRVACRATRAAAASSSADDPGGSDGDGSDCSSAVSVAAKHSFCASVRLTEGGAE